MAADREDGPWSQPLSAWSAGPLVLACYLYFLSPHSSLSCSQGYPTLLLEPNSGTLEYHLDDPLCSRSGHADRNGNVRVQKHSLLC